MGVADDAMVFTQPGRICRSLPPPLLSAYAYGHDRAVHRSASLPPDPRHVDRLSEAFFTPEDVPRRLASDDGPKRVPQAFDVPLRKERLQVEIPGRKKAPLG
jgi:hypothetical protein